MTSDANANFAMQYPPSSPDVHSTTFLHVPLYLSEPSPTHKDFDPYSPPADLQAENKLTRDIFR